MQQSIVIVSLSVAFSFSIYIWFFWVTFSLWDPVLLRNRDKISIVIEMVRGFAAL